MDVAHDEDFYTWALQQAELARRRAGNVLDWDHVAEELRLLGVSEERELESRYIALLTHLLKWIHQPEKRSRSWENTIANQRAALSKHLKRNPGLKGIEPQEFLDAYAFARREASSQTDLPLETFPEEPAFTLEDAKNPGWTPD